ncbi:CbtA family protein [Hoyosella rhizosphaerae]|uniref:Membrane protein n=1 Tax=Hoyosella rhizosphaerae TaxID=1755582 RepID=A0A916U978_9ACTN|nr:CbtA family protein [Hoyosella rhizosphaerae]MBN4927436.1 CbtA family protein [Hoyosella rhizosphaerae]GGC64402.1 membrane protein [Hoyosella rhizosphaerae]
MPLADTKLQAPSATQPLTGSLAQLLKRGAIAGILAGLVAGAVAFGLGESLIDDAIAIEEAAAHAGNHAHDHDELVSRFGQKIGLILATTLVGLAFGLILATVAHHATRFVAASATSLVLGIALCGWLAFEAVPFVKYPANPPAVGDPETINERTWLWLATVVLGFVAIAAALVSRVWVRHRSSIANIATPTVVFAAVVSLGYVMLPSIDEVGADFPASLLWDFRVASFVTQLTLWLTLGFMFAFLTERAQPVRK